MKNLFTLAVCLLPFSLFAEDTTVDLSSGWTFDKGAEFPGAAGRLNSPPAGGLELAYDFSGGGVFVVANRSASLPPFTALEILAKGTGAQMGVTLYDASDEVFVFDNVAVVGETEQRYAVDLAKPATSWGGNGDKVIQFPLRGLRIMVYRKNSVAPAGSLSIKEIRLKSE